MDKKIKYRIFLKDQKNFPLAGLYDTFVNNSGESIKAFTIITTKANKKVGEIHDRMPAILADSNISKWLDPEYNKISELKDFLVPYAKDDLIIKPELENTQMSLDF